MSSPYGEPKPPPFPAPGTNPGIGLGGDSPELIEKAASAFNLAIGSIFVGMCCCGIAGLIMGIISMNNAGAVIAMSPVGSESNTKASSAKTLAIVGIVLSILQMIGGAGISVMSNMNQ